MASEKFLIKFYENESTSLLLACRGTHSILLLSSFFPGTSKKREILITFDDRENLSLVLILLPRILIRNLS